MKNYLALLQDIRDNGHTHEDRTGVGRRSVFGRELRFDLSEGKFPLVTTRKIFTRGMITEMLWFLSGSTNALELEVQGVNLWKPWVPTQEDADAFVEKLITEKLIGTLPLSIQHKLADAYMNLPAGPDNQAPEIIDAVKAFFADKIGTIGKLYGSIWRGNYTTEKGFAGPDQITALIEGLRTNPFGSRHTVTAQIPEFLPLAGFSPKENVLLGLGALAPCHCYFQCFVSPASEQNGKLRLSLKIEIRSNDLPVGNPYNTAQYALLTMMLAQCVGMVPHELIVSIGDGHIYTSQLEGVKEQLTREPFPLPTMKINPAKKDIFSFTIEDFTLENYQCHEKINYPVAV